jgi:hypothetical protein
VGNLRQKAHAIPEDRLGEEGDDRFSSATNPISPSFGSHRAAKKPLFKPFQAFKPFKSLEFEE